MGRDDNSVVPMVGIHMRFALMLRVAWELYLRHGKDVNLGIHQYTFESGAVSAFQHFLHPHQRWPATG